MEWLIGAIILSVLFTVLLYKYYYPSIFFKKLKRNLQKQGKFLGAMISWEFFLLSGAFLDHSENTVLDTIITVTILIALLAIWQWRRWGVYLLFIALGSVFIIGIIEFFLIIPQYLLGLFVFIVLSVLQGGVWVLALRRKWGQFV